MTTPAIVESPQADLIRALESIRCAGNVGSYAAERLNIELLAGQIEYIEATAARARALLALLQTEQEVRHA